MFFPEGQVRVFVFGEPVSMRLSFDGLYALTRNALQQDPLSGHLFTAAAGAKMLEFCRFEIADGL